MPLFYRLTHLSRLTFFVSMGVVATLLDACASKRNDEHSSMQPGTGGSFPDEGILPGASGATIVGPTVGSGGGMSKQNIEAAAGSISHKADADPQRKSTSPKKSARQRGPRTDDGLHDIICE
jgi:hypothetical protein